MERIIDLCRYLVGCRTRLSLSEDDGLLEFKVRNRLCFFWLVPVFHLHNSIIPCLSIFVKRT